MFVYRAVRELGSLAAALGGLDAVVFTAGVGENQPEIRARILRQAAWLGLRDRRSGECTAGPVHHHRGIAGSPAYVVPTDEESMIARHVLGHLGHG